MAEDKRLWRRRVRDIVPYQPGKPIEEVVREFGVQDVVKLASNENPLGPSPRALEAMAAALPKVHLYPDASGYELREALAKRLELPSSCILLGNGTAEIIELVTEAFLGPDEIAVTGDQAFFKYRIAVQIMDGRLVSLPMPDMTFDIDAILGQIEGGRQLEGGRQIEAGAKLVFIANPNNPTGRGLGRAEVDRLVDALDDDQILVLDEAYHEYVERDDHPDGLDYVRQGRNVVVLRTFSKAYGLAGLRIGYAVGREDIIAGMWRVKEAFNTSSLAQVAALAALDDVEHLERTRALNREGKAALYRFFDELGLRYWPSETNFVLVDLGRSAGPVVDGLLRRGVIVRPMGAYHLDTCVRVSVGTPEQMRRFELGLREVLGR